MFLFDQQGRPVPSSYAFVSPSGLTDVSDEHALLRAKVTPAGLPRLRVFLQRNQLTAVPARADGRHLMPIINIKAAVSELQALGYAAERGPIDGWSRIRLRAGLQDPAAEATRVQRATGRKAEAEEWVAFERRAFVPNDPRYPDQWHLHATLTGNAVAASHINAELAWDVTRGAGSILAVLDDGIFVNHEDLVANLVPKVGGGSIMKDFIDDDDDPSPEIGDGHGTRVAGTAAARGNNALGVSGVCPECGLIPVRLFSSGSFDADALFGPASLAAAAFNFAADNGARVIVNSWGPIISRSNPQYQGPPAIVTDAILALARRAPAADSGAIGKAGVLFAWAAGNNFRSLMTYDGWASDPRVVAVGASNANAQLADYSDIGPPIRLLAPSSNSAGGLPRIQTTDNAVSAYSSSFGGTSAAAPVLGGAAALLFAAYPELSLAQAIELLMDGAAPIDTANAEYDNEQQSCTHGRGRLDIWRSLQLAAERQANYAAGYTIHFELCEDGIDNDNDPSTPDNSGACARCIPSASQEIAGNSIDDDCDGYVDNDGPCVGNVRSRCGVCANNTECRSGLSCKEIATGKFCLQNCSVSAPCGTDEVCLDGSCLPQKSGLVRFCRDPSRCVVTGTEVCDGVDNDCNGQVDDLNVFSAETLSAVESCRVGTVGVCAAQRAECRNGSFQCVAPPEYQPIETLCDKLDNDCNGRVDENDCASVEPTPSNGVKPTAKGCNASASAPSLACAVALLLSRILSRILPRGRRGRNQPSATS